MRRSLTIFYRRAVVTFACPLILHPALAVDDVEAVELIHGAENEQRRR